MIRSLIAGSAGVFFSLPVMAETMQLNMTPGVTAVSQDVYGLHMTILYICIAIGVVVFGAMFWAIFHHRKSKGAKPPRFMKVPKLKSSGR